MLKKIICFLPFIFLFLMIFKVDVFAVSLPGRENLPDLIINSPGSYYDDSIFLTEIDFSEDEYTEEELSVAQGIESVLSYLDASLSIESNTSTIIAGKKVICDDITGTLEEVSTVYSTNLLVNKVIAYALTKEGCEYNQAFREAYNIFDCSSFVRRMYMEYSGVYLGNTSEDIANKLWNYQVPMNAIEPGDLLWHRGHIALYIGNGQIIHAAGRRQGVVIANVYGSFTNAFRPIDYIKEVKGSEATKTVNW